MEECSCAPENSMTAPGGGTTMSSSTGVWFNAAGRTCRSPEIWEAVFRRAVLFW